MIILILDQQEYMLMLGGMELVVDVFGMIWS